MQHLRDARPISTSQTPPAPYLDPSGHVCEAASTPDVWRVRVKRLASYFLRNERETAESFDERECAACGLPVSLNHAIYARDEPYFCGDTLYQGAGARDGYWYAIALLGADPEAPTPTTRIGWWRRARLARACRSVGLVFGEVGGAHA